MGPFPGTLALAVHSTGVLGELYSETLEAVPTRPEGGPAILPLELHRP